MKIVEHSGQYNSLAQYIYSNTLSVQYIQCIFKNVFTNLNEFNTVDYKNNTNLVPYCVFCFLFLGFYFSQLK